jgi:hypothetical protein
MEWMIPTQTPPEATVNLNVKYSVKLELEKLQEEIRLRHNLRARPPMNEVVKWLLQSRPPVESAA